MGPTASNDVPAGLACQRVFDDTHVHRLPRFGPQLGHVRPTAHGTRQPEAGEAFDATSATSATSAFLSSDEVPNISLLKALKINEWGQAIAYPLRR